MIPGTPRSPTGTDCHEETNWQRLTHALTPTLSTAGDRRLQLIKASLTSGSVAKWGKQVCVCAHIRQCRQMGKAGDASAGPSPGARPGLVGALGLGPAPVGGEAAGKLRDA
ncbi:MAG: hypothetical protein ACK5LH_05750 [Akkermansiaceae bacterium]